MNMSEDLFSKLGLEVSTGEIEVGKTYPLYGMITKIISEEEDAVIVEINFGIEARMKVGDASKIELIKERAFEPGIFVSVVITKDPVVVDCVTVVFGKKQRYEA